MDMSGTERMVTSAAIERPGDGGLKRFPTGPLAVALCHAVVTWGWWNCFAHGAPFDAHSHTFWICVVAGGVVWPINASKPLWRAGLVGQVFALAIVGAFLYPFFAILPDCVALR
jgi:hypothetical protein